jgi:hypothetical protein
MAKNDPPSGGSKNPKPTRVERDPPRSHPEPTIRAEPGLPTAEEDAIIQRYVHRLSDLRWRLAELRRIEAKVPRDAKLVDRARAAYEAMDRELQAIEDEAVKRTDGELVNHLDPLAKERNTLKQGGIAATDTGERISCRAVENAPKNLRGMDFADLESAMKRPPDEVDAASQEPGRVASAHQRLVWVFEDGSRLIVDKPVVPLKPSGRPRSAELPHVELHGPRGERLDQQGIIVPEESISAHMTITDHTNALKHHFAPARGTK